MPTRDYSAVTGGAHRIQIRSKQEAYMIRTPSKIDQFEAILCDCLVTLKRALNAYLTMQRPVRACAA